MSVERHLLNETLIRLFLSFLFFNKKKKKKERKGIALVCDGFWFILSSFFKKNYF
jgi:hypothetical protein